MLSKEFYLRNKEGKWRKEMEGGRRGIRKAKDRAKEGRAGREKGKKERYNRKPEK